MATENQRRTLSMVTLTALGLICLALLPTTDSKPLCPELLNVMELFLTGSKEDYMNSVKSHVDTPRIINTAEKLKDCVETSMNPEKQKKAYDFVEHLSQDVCQKTL
ncbi:major allergen I polypeptide chain 1-like [Dromiciops gliroides]|uniref:major allergen I polypeptide chain 1-like n=1 Tax=Dromiciops gliroides TaxID=33562 RepID=UPI001CC6226C|nr:major allergen I polypeptide chain 1-like [Dromiciops gliroides]